MKKLALIFCIFAPILAFSQTGVRWDLGGPITGVTTVAGYGQQTLLAVPNVKLNFCQSPGNVSFGSGVPCTNYATTYTDATLATPCSNSTQIVQQGTSTCVATSDIYGNLGAYAPAGNYAYTLTVGSTTFGPYAVTLALGTCTVTSAYLHGECYASLAAAIASLDCPATGCTVDMTSPNANHALGTVSTAGTSKTVRVLLGEGNYTLDHIVCYGYLDIGGLGMIGPGAGTYITSSGLNSQPLIVASQSNNYSTGCNVHGMSLVALPGNTSQEIILLDVSTLSVASLQNSRFYDLGMTGFNGSAIEIKGRANDANSAVQFSKFENIYAFAGASPVAPVVKITGYTGQLDFENVLANDGVSTQDVLYMGPNGATGQFAPSGTNFLNFTPQGGGTCLHMGGAGTTTFNKAFVEACPTLMSLTQDSSTQGYNSNNGITLENSYAAGSGLATIVSDTDSNSVVHLHNNAFFGTPSNFITGANAANVQYCDNSGGAALTFPKILGCYKIGPFQFGSIGSTVNAVLRGNGIALNSAFTAIAAQTCQEQTLTLTGAATTGVSAATPSATIGANLSWTSWISATNAITVRVCNPSSGSLTPTSVTWNASVIQ